MCSLFWTLFFFYMCRVLVAWEASGSVLTEDAYDQLEVSQKDAALKVVLAPVTKHLRCCQAPPDSAERRWVPPVFSRP